MEGRAGTPPPPRRITFLSEKSGSNARMPGGGIPPYKRPIGMCRWMGSHLNHDWIDYNVVAFSIELLEWGRTFFDFCSLRASSLGGGGAGGGLSIN